MSNSDIEPGEIEIPEESPPGKLQFDVAVYGWFRHVHGEVDEAIAAMDHSDYVTALNKLHHINDSFEEGLRELELFIPEELREGALARASSRREAMASHPLPPFPTHASRGATTSGESIAEPLAGDPWKTGETHVIETTDTVDDQ